MEINESALEEVSTLNSSYVEASELVGITQTQISDGNRT